jgi:glycosyltransferase involved in cell wall biosynthesis
VASSTDPLVSIVTPTFNQGHLIAETLRSVRRQTYPTIEHIVVDAGSTDGTLDTLRDAEGTYRMSFTSEPDNGMYDAINKGMARAGGEIVSYLNSDDLLLPWAVEVAVAALRDTPEAGLVYGDALALDDRTRRLDLRLQVPLDTARLARFGSLAQPSVFWRRSVTESLGGFNTDLQFVGDLDLWLRLSSATVVRQLDEVLSVYRVHDAAKTIASEQAMRLEEDRVRAQHHGSASARQRLSARVSYRLAERRRMLEFARATRSAVDPRWSRFREAYRPRVRAGSFTVALLPVIARFLKPRWLDLAELDA